MSMNEKKLDKSVLTIRVANKEDENFIYSCWMRGVFYNNEYMRGQITEDAFFKMYRSVIKKVLKREDVSCLMACIIEQPDVVVGFSVFEPGVLHWVYVKQAWRGFGIAKELVPDGVHSVTHLTKQAAEHKPKEWVFNPYLI